MNRNYIRWLACPVIFIFVSVTSWVHVWADTGNTGKDTTSGTVYIMTGTPAPWDGILLKPIDAARLLQDAKSANAKVKAWQDWAKGMTDLTRKSDTKACDLQVQYWKEGYKTLQKQKTSHGLPVWAVVVLGIGALGLGVGLGVGLGLHYR